ncbi:Glycoside hydrolase, partial [Globisporangium polare]
RLARPQGVRGDGEGAERQGSWQLRRLPGRPVHGGRLQGARGGDRQARDACGRADQQLGRGLGRRPGQPPRQVVGARAGDQRQGAVLPRGGAASAAGRGRRVIRGRQRARDQRGLNRGFASAADLHDRLRHVQGCRAPPDARAVGQAGASPERRPHPRERH